MGSNMNFRGFGNDPPANGGGGRPPGNNNLMRESSIYSLTFDELQTTMGGSLGKDFGSMNMDELLKNIWSAEEVQSMASVGAGGGSFSAAAQFVGAPAAPLQRQGSLTLPRTLSQKTVDEVWRGFPKEENSAVNNLPQRQLTLGEITLEEFLVRAGVVREDNNAAQFGSKPPNGSDFFGSSNANLVPIGSSPGLMSNRIAETNVNPIPIQASNLPLNVNGVRSSQPQLPTAAAPPPQQQIFPKQAAGVAYAPQLGSPHAFRAGMMGTADQGCGGGMGMVGLGAAAAAMAAVSGSPANHMSSDGMKSNGDTSSVSPVPFVFNGGLRGRKVNGAVEKVVERRQRRMIKNRESAARSRARKQAYTMELEAEKATLKEENDELKKKQKEMQVIQKNQEMQLMEMQKASKKRCLRRTRTGPW